MREDEWLTHREAIIALFSRTQLATWCELDCLENESGESPQDVYTRKIKNCHFLLVLIGDTIPAGVKDEIRIAKELNKPILIYRQKGKSLSEEDEKFLKDDVYRETTVATYSSIGDLLTKIEQSLLHFIIRRLEDNRESKNLAKITAVELDKASAAPPAPEPSGVATMEMAAEATATLLMPKTSGASAVEVAEASAAQASLELSGTDKPIIGKAGKGQLLAFAAACSKVSQQSIAVPTIERAIKACPNDIELFQSLNALKLSANPVIGIPDGDGERLMSMASHDVESFALACAVSIITDRYEASTLEVPILTELDDKQEQVEALIEIAHLFSAFFISGDASPETINQHYKRMNELLETLDCIKPIQGIDVFENVCRIVRKAFQTVSITNEFIPKVECCLNCMPWDGGEPVELTASRGSLEELTLENLYGTFPDVEWCNFVIHNISTHCQGCGSELTEHDDAYESMADEPDEDGNEQVG